MRVGSEEGFTMRFTMAKAAAALAAAALLVSVSPATVVAGGCIILDEFCDVEVGENCFDCPEDCGSCCGNESCESEYAEDCTTCPLDCGACDTTTTTHPEIVTTTTFPVETTTTTDTTSTTMQATGACCYADQCGVKSSAECARVEGYYAGDGTSCSLQENVCPAVCGDGCVTFGEQCDDANTENLDGCNEKCETETCWFCFEPQQGLPRTVIVPGCVGPSICSFDVENPECTTCGNGEVEPGEDCDPGDGIDPCCSNCVFAGAGTPCDDGTFCNGVEQCDGEGTCSAAEAGPDCSSFDSECTEGVCDFEADECVGLPIEGPCSDIGDCEVEGSGQCVDGVCVGAGTTLSPTCRWIIVGATPGGDPVRLRSGRGSVVDANTCSDTAKLAGISLDSHVAIATTGEGIRFYGPPEVAGDIVTGGASVEANLYLTIPGTSVKTLAGGTTLAKTPDGTTVDTMGTHELVSLCAGDKIALGLAKPLLDDKIATETAGGPKGLKIQHGASFPIDVTGDGVAVVEMQSLKVGHGATLVLQGNPTDVLMLKIGGRMKLGYGARVVLEGLVPQNVLIYANGTPGSPCRVSPGVVGAGTIYCPNARRFVMGVGTNWSGTFLGASTEVQVRLGAELTHVPFTGF